MSDLKLTGIHKFYGGVHAVKGVDLEIPSGEFTVLVGPSGCGKSTLLRCIAGLEEVDSGRIDIGGKDVTDARPRDRDIAMVFQSYALYPYMSVYENIAFGLRARKMPEAEIKKRVMQATEMLNIGALLQRRPRELSGGQRQRVAIGRAIVRDARLFLFDEPLSNLDAQLRDEMRLEIKKLHQDLKRTMIYVTHDQIEAMTLADRIVLLRDGIVEQLGAPLDLFNRPKSRFVAEFLGSPKVNLIPAIASNGVVKVDSEITLQLPGATGLKAAPVLFGIRPQNISRAGIAGKNDQSIMEIVAGVVQITGTRALVTFTLGGNPMIADLEVGTDCRTGNSIKIKFDMNRAILVDPQSGITIYPLSNAS
jgi:multiple sugar transport system ATP-binding protein